MKNSINRRQEFLVDRRLHHVSQRSADQQRMCDLRIGILGDEKDLRLGSDRVDSRGRINSAKLWHPYVQEHQAGLKVRGFRHSIEAVCSLGYTVKPVLLQLRSDQRAKRRKVIGDKNVHFSRETAERHKIQQRDDPPSYERAQVCDTIWYQMNRELRVSLIIRCSPDEAARIRSQASSEHRSLSGYLLYVLERSFRIEDKLGGLPRSFFLDGAESFRSERHGGVRTAVHLRCTDGEAARIRAYAARRHLSISDFVVFSLSRSWNAIEQLRRSAQMGRLEIVPPTTGVPQTSAPRRVAPEDRRSNR